MLEAGLGSTKIEFSWAFVVLVSFHRRLSLSCYVFRSQEALEEVRALVNTSEICFDPPVLPDPKYADEFFTFPFNNSIVGDGELLLLALLACAVVFIMMIILAVLAYIKLN